MTGELRTRDAMIALLRSDAALLLLVNQISDGDPGKASPPWLRVGDAVATDWGARQVDGRTMRLPIQLALRGDALAPVAAIVERVDTLLREATLDIAPWRITLLRLERSQIGRNQTGWSATMDYTVRLARLH